MKLTSLETIRPTVQPNVCFVRLHSEAGLIGLGESFYAADSVEAYLHEAVAPLLTGLSDPSPQAVAALLAPYTGYQGGGVEQRANGAVDVALWDLLGHTSDLSLARLLGGPVRQSIRTYNTCAGSRYISSSVRQTSANWGLTQTAQPYEDLEAFLTRPGELARELLDEGITAMKIWPFDQAAERSGGLDIGVADLRKAIGIVEAIRSEVGSAMEVMIELHALWNRLAATKIARALADVAPYWIEDPLRPDAADAYRRLRDDIDVPIAAGETCVGRRGFLPLLTGGSIDIVTVDIGWTGGLTEAVKVSSLADAVGVPLAPHDCTGPVSLAVSAHLACSQPNGLIQESSRAFVRTWYPEVAEGLPKIENGVINLSPAPGHGVRLRDDFTEGPAASRRVSRL
ncbi:mandelate racemase/muconate lactonizing enzyme family protein [uncultured Jatrophihabitans sp.]|uniref:mandelate racemase/muconate lactonizing enzyme family protein n=1 Tax=uncultured Jatrophihabitans sp. TaxID=1610747 RepID=UPI0035CAB226